MRKVQKISELQPTIGFTEFDIYRDYQKSFFCSELGKLHAVFPFAALATAWGLCEHPLGRDSYFSAEGKIALMVLKAYTSLSDKALIAQLNSNIHYQLFCGIRLNPLNPLTNYKIVSEIRCELGRSLDIDRLQQILASHWKPYLANVSVLMTDATCYESSLRYPTDVKILWESVAWVHHQIYLVVKTIKGRMPRSKYGKQSRRYYAYARKRRRSQSETRILKRSLLHLLHKLTAALEDTVKHSRPHLKLSAHFYKRISVIKEVYRQQHVRFLGGEVKDLIVSIDKSYIHPIVRGKERKRVEFGAKVNMIQVDGLNFIEHLSFSAFNEGIRIPQCITAQQRLFRKKVTHLASRSYLRHQLQPQILLRAWHHHFIYPQGAGGKRRSAGRPDAQFARQGARHPPGRQFWNREAALFP
jgi:hypothetical protein